MILIHQSGAFQIMCKHIQLKAYTWYYRRRIPEDCRELHRVHGTGKKPDQLYFSLKTTDKTEACKRADSHTRRLDALWKAHREGEVSPKISLALLKAAGLTPGDGERYPDTLPVSNFIDDLRGRYEFWQHLRCPLRCP